MNHPLFHTRPFLSYLAGWMVLALLQTLVSVQALDMNVERGLEDAFLSHMWGAALGLSIWYALAFHIFKHSFFTGLVHHLALGGAFALLWAGGIYTFFATLYADNPMTLHYLQIANPWRLTVGVIYYIMLAMGYALMHSVEALRERVSNEARLQGLLHQSELALLKSQLNPHFLFNSLNSVSALISLDPGKAENMVGSLAEFLRYSITAPAHASLPLEDEVRNARRYLSIEQIRFGDKLTYRDEIAPECRQIRVPTMLLQPLFENAVKHGAAECVGPALITTLAYIEQDYLHIEIRNTLERPSTRKGTGLGLRNVRDRLRLFYGEGKSRLQCGPEENSFIVHMVLPKEIPATGS